MTAAASKGSVEGSSLSLDPTVLLPLRRARVTQWSGRVSVSAGSSDLAVVERGGFIEARHVGATRRPRALMATGTPRDDSSRVTSTSRFGSVALRDQSSISYYLNSKIERGSSTLYSKAGRHMRHQCEETQLVEKEFRARFFSQRLSVLIRTRNRRLAENRVSKRAGRKHQ